MFASSGSQRSRSRVLIAVTTTACAVTGLTIVTMETASAATGTPVVAVASGRCLDVVGNNNADKALVNIYDCKGAANQAWTTTAAGELRVFDTKCLDVAGQSTTAPAVAQIYTCNGGTNQQWKINTDGTIVGAQSGLCLDVSGEGTANSTPVGLFTCGAGKTNQQWKVASSDTQTPTVPANPRVSNLKCVSVDFAWDAATDNVGVAFYDIYHDGQLIKSVPGGTLSASLVVVGGTTWGLYVDSRDAAGNVSQGSATVSITPPFCAPDTQAPTAPTALAGTVSGTTVTLTWGASTDNVLVKAYDIFRNGTKAGSVTTTPPGVPAGTSFTDSGLAATTKYAYYVVARDAQGNVSINSNTANVTTAGGCTNPVCEVTQIGTERDIPWGLVTLADGTILYNRRDTHEVVHLNPATGVVNVVGTVPNVDETNGEGGLLGLELSPTFASDHWLYIMHTSPTDNRIVRIKMDNGTLNLGSEQILLTGIKRNVFHNGGRLRFGPDGKLYASTGDGQNGDNAQDKNSLNGKVLRLNPDGSIPSDNPLGNYVWSYGHRNPQGLAFDSQGRLWEQEFGNATQDETNLITKGGNYGWPECEGTVSQSGGGCGTAGFIAPKHTYPTGDGSCSGIAIVRDVLYVACERGTRMYREVISGSDLTNVQQYFNGTYGRLRTVEPAPDGGLWLTTTGTTTPPGEANNDKDSIPNNSNERLFHVALGG